MTRSTEWSASGDDSAAAAEKTVLSIAGVFASCFKLTSVPATNKNRSASGTVAWPLPHAQSHANSRRGTASASQSNSAGGYSGRNRAYSSATREKWSWMATDELYPVFRAAVEDHSTIEPVTTTKTVSVPPLIEALPITAFCPDGWLYVADSAIPDQMMRSRDHIAGAVLHLPFPTRIRRHPRTVGVGLFLSAREWKFNSTSKCLISKQAHGAPFLDFRRQR